MLKLHHEIPKLSRGQQLEGAADLAADPGELARAFTESVERFAAYDNRDEGFVGSAPRKPLEWDREAIHRTNDLAGRLERDGGLEISGRLDLAADYVAREVSVMRTTGAATFDDPAAVGMAGRALQPDLLLANRADRTPIVAEVKITRPGTQQTDKNPFAALIQVLAAAAHLATLAQYERMRLHFPAAGLAAPPSDGPRLDIYLIAVAHDDRITDMAAIFKATRQISQKLIDDKAVARSLRRIAFLDIAPAGTPPLQATPLFVTD
jgi:hypothetical protein